MAQARPGLQLAAELVAKLRPSWAKGRWREAAISAKNRAKIRREFLLAGEEWPLDTAPKERRDVRFKGHKCDREAADRKEKIAENMAKMPELLAQMKKRRQEGASAKGAGR